MNQPTKLNAIYSATGQISLDDIADIAKAGFQTIITLRPDLEGGADQPSSTKIALACQNNGITHQYIPVQMGNITSENIAAFEKIYATSPKPILAYCKSGGRATNLFNLSNVNQNHAGETSAKPNGLLAWFKSKCLITRVYRAIKAIIQPKT